MKDKFDELFEKYMAGLSGPGPGYSVLNTTMGNPNNKQTNPLGNTMGNPASSDPTGAADPGAGSSQQQQSSQQQSTTQQQATPPGSESENMANAVLQTAMGDIEKIISANDPGAAAGIIRTALAGNPAAAKNVSSYIEQEPGNWQNFQTTLRNKLGQLSNMSQSFQG